ncbi:uncharacterized protein Gyg isoform X2 [Eurosta solidaginis]
MRQRLQDVYNVVQEVNVLDSQDAANLALLARPELGVTFTKLHCWRLVQFEKCVFLDADTLVLHNVDELFEREELSAAPDVSWPDCFNSGVFVYRPSLETFAKITEFAVQNGSFDGGDQGLLNLYFADWAHSDIKKHLPFVYNVAAFASYCYLPAFKQFRDKIKILHFAGKLKPWLIQFNSENRTALTPTEYAHAADLIQLWWNIFCDNVHQNLSTAMYGVISHYYYHYQQQQPAKQPQYEHYHHHYEHEHYHENQQHHNEEYYHHHENQQEKPAVPQFYEFENIKEFHDPWEDYYENLGNVKEDNTQHTIQTEKYEEQAVCQSEPTPEWHEHEEVVQKEAIFNAWIEETNKYYDHCQYQEEEKEEPIEQCDHGCYENHQSYETDSVHEQSTNISISNDIQSNQNFEASSTSQTKNYEIDVHNVYTATKEEQDFFSIQRDDVTADIISSSCSIDKQINHNEEVNESESESKDNQYEAGLAGALSQLRLGEQRTPEQEAYEQHMRRQCWEAGQIDYTGKDSFDNIWKKITETLESKPSASAPKEEEKSALKHVQRSITTKRSVPPTAVGIEIIETESERLERINRLLEQSAADIEDQKVVKLLPRPLFDININNASARSISPTNNTNSTNRGYRRTASPNPFEIQDALERQLQQQRTEQPLQQQPRRQTQPQAPQRQSRQQQQPQTSQTQPQTASNKQMPSKTNRKSK